MSKIGWCACLKLEWRVSKIIFFLGTFARHTSCDITIIYLGWTVIQGAAETWGFVHANLDHLLADLAVLAAQRQRDRGCHPTRWLAKWRTQISLQLATTIGKALLAAVPANVRPWCVHLGG